MAPISKSSATVWTRKTSNVPDYRCSSILNSDGNSSNYSSSEENPRIDRKNIPSFMLNDDMNGRSYVDPWDMENYSFLRRQLEDVNLSDNEVSSTPAFESTQSDFYYVPLDNNGSPQYQYKHYIDSGLYKDGISTPFAFRGDSYGLVANIDEHDFYNEHLDTAHPSLQSANVTAQVELPVIQETATVLSNAYAGLNRGKQFEAERSGDSYPEFSNPSRQSERSRYNNQDYQTYMPPSIIKDSHDVYETRRAFDYPNRKSSFRYFSDLNLNSIVLEDHYSFSPGYVDHIPRRRKNVEFELKENKDEAKINRRKSFHELTSDDPRKQERRRKSVLDQTEDYRPVYDIGVPDYRPKENITRRKSIHEIATDVTKIGKNFISQRIPRKSVLHSSENFEKGAVKERAYGELSHGNLPRPHLSPVPESSLVYVYETAKRRRKIVLPNSGAKSTPPENKYGYSGYEDGFSMDPIEDYISQPVSRYTMTNYGHLKIDYSCSWNCLDKYIAHRIRT